MRTDNPKPPEGPHVMVAPEMLTTGQVARYFRLDHYHVKEVIRKNMVPAPIKVGRSNLILKSDLPAYESAFKTLGYQIDLPE